MAHEIVTFESGEFEIALVTYNRCEFVAEWLEHCFIQTKIRNISLSIWDSSTNPDTEEYIKEFNVKENADITYYHVSSETSVGYKPIFPLLSVSSKYVWVSGDSRYHDFNLLDQKIFPYLKQNIDYIVLHAVNNEENDGKVYTDRNEFLRECFLSMTCIGLSIFKTSIFEPIKGNSALKKECDRKYKDNYGFGWMGYFLEIYALKNYKALFSVIPIINIKSEKKIRSWFKRYYHCWVEDLCNLAEYLSEKYKHTDIILKDTWKYLTLDRPSICYDVRKAGDLNSQTFSEYKNNGMFDKVTKHIDRLERFANCPIQELDACLEQELELEKKFFKELCCRNFDKVKRLSKGYKLWIYGAGAGGRISARYFNSHSLSVCGFVDQSAEKIKSFEGLPVKTIKDLASSDCFIFISLFHWAPFVVNSLIAHGIEKDKILYISLDHM